MSDNRIISHHQPARIFPECVTPVPEHIQRKANGLLLRYFSGERLSKKVKCSGKKGGVYPVLKINIGSSWRLLSTDNGQSWKLMSHERYNKMISR
ncbi:hypothetical protein ACRZTF_001047 [Escherichia coli]|uniref:ParE-like toxin domain-containing protein n=1 Tax=Proteus faecis TaxID=2050967 RepID=A0AAW7CVU6_9GAMM|nr:MULTISPECIES: hypothetical protein [Enterobacterales]EFN7277228.1 hypothetical protein [Escherichia coli O7:H7]APL04649.1 hypothetical protein RG56_15685 [Escherichia coli]APL14432.1 hypothetical protein RG58_15670 [Escherichia coli]APL21323.1 hypothetical protein RG60_00240 [Escherichia coli]APL27042.1 hypothetical protein RG61_04150 [Escherichia coli]